MKVKIIKYADALKELVHSLFSKYIPDINKTAEKIKEEVILEINNNKYTLRDLYILFGEKLKRIDKKYIKDKNFEEIFTYLFEIPLNKIKYIKINDVENNRKKRISKIKFLKENMEPIILDFISKYENILLNYNKEIWKKILEYNLNQKQKENEETIYITTDLRYPYEKMNIDNQIMILIMFYKNNQLYLNEEFLMKNLKEVKKFYLKSNNISEFSSILLNKFKVKKSEEFTISLILHFYFNKENKNIEKELNELFPNLIIFKNSKEIPKEVLIDATKEIYNNYIKHNKFVNVCGGRRTGKDFFTNILKEIIENNENKEIYNFKLTSN